MKFNIEDYKGNYAMHCKTKEEVKDFCRYLYSLGRKWCDGTKYTEDNMWYVYKDNTCYVFNYGTYSSLSFSELSGYTVLEWSDFMNKKFTKADLKSGDVVLRRNGVVEIVCRETDSLISKDDFNYLSDVEEDLTFFDFESGWDIIAVRRPRKPLECQFNAFDKRYGELVYKRKETEETTLEEVCKALGKEIKIVKKH